MFTGIIRYSGQIINTIEDQIKGLDSDRSTNNKIDIKLEIVILISKINIKKGDSISVNGICLTVVKSYEFSEYDQPAIILEFQISKETLQVTTVKYWKQHDRVNLELSMSLGDHLDGHIVTGHVDGISKLIERKKITGSYGMIFSIPKGLNTYIVQKGSIAIDGVSLTVNKVSSKNFEVNIISHTNDNTILGGIEVGDKVNIEIDIIARYAINAINKYNKIR